MNIDWIQLTSNALFLGMNAFLVQRLTNHLDKMTERLEVTEQRHDVNDRILSSVIGQEYSSEGIAKNNQPFPRVLRHRES